MENSVIVLYFVIFLTLVSCHGEPLEYAHNCGEINYDIGQWSLSDKIEKDSLVFVNQDNEEVVFYLKNVSFSEPYQETAIDTSSVVCEMVKTISYASDSLDIEFITIYVQHQNLATVDQTFIRYGFTAKADSEYFMVPNSIFWPKDQWGTLETEFIEIDSISYGQQKYNDVLRIEFETMLNQKNETIPAKYINTVSFLPGKGLVEMHSYDHGPLILKNQ